MKKLPYGISNFAEIPKRDYFFADKTPFLHKLEDLGEKYIFLLRPRRFGKSLWISILQHYYGTQYKERFQDLFGKYYVGKNPTENANNYLILRFDFSGIDTSTAESTYQGFLSNVKMGTQKFFESYGHLYSKTQVKETLSKQAPEDMLKSLFASFSDTNSHKVYLLIDEYDHFTNELLALNLKHFRAIVGRNGWVRKFYETIKTATGEGVVERMFVTGVSPATLDSMTSGFNIASSLTRDSNFHEMFGFNEAEVMDLLENVGVTEENMPYTLAQMRAWYDGFKMNAKAKNHIYNPDMVLFFGKEYLSAGTFPDKMLDDNIATDYGKIRGIFQIENQESQRVPILKQLLEEGSVPCQIVSRFNFEMEFGDREFISLLFYMGMLSIKDQDFSVEILQIPNYVIKALYYEYFYQLLREEQLMPTPAHKVTEVVRVLAKYGDTEPLKELVNNILAEHSLRDKANFSEKHLKTIFITLFYISNIYVVDSEPETKQKFMDILLIGRKDFKIPHNYLFELKYAKKPKKEEKNVVENAENEEFDENKWLAKLREETITQLNTYRNTEKVKNIENLRSYILIVADMKIAFFEEIL